MGVHRVRRGLRPRRHRRRALRPHGRSAATAQPVERSRASRRCSPISSPICAITRRPRTYRSSSSKRRCERRGRLLAVSLAGVRTGDRGASNTRASAPVRSSTPTTSRSARARRSRRRWWCSASPVKCSRSVTRSVPTRSRGSNASIRSRSKRSRAPRIFPAARRGPAVSPRTRTVRCTSCTAITRTGSPPTSRAAVRELPRRLPYNSFVVTPDGHLVTKDFGGVLPGQDPALHTPQPAELLVLEPDALEIVARCAIPEPSIARISADGDDVYAVGTSTLFRVALGRRAARPR